MTITDCKALLIWNHSRHSAPTHPQHLHNKSDVTGDFLTSDRDILSPVMENMKLLDYVLRAPAHLSSRTQSKYEWHFQFGSECCWEPGVRAQTVSQPEHSRLCDVKPTFSMLGGVHCNFKEWWKYLWAARLSSLDYISLHLLYRKEDSAV